MRRVKKLAVYFLLLALIILCLVFVFGQRTGNPNPGQVFPTVLTTVIPLTEVTEATEMSDSSVEDQLARIDQILNQSVQSSIAYNVPARAELNKAVTIELLLNPSLSPTELAGQVTQDGEVVTTVIEITPMMKAELIPQDADGLMIQPLHADAVQLIGSLETTRWVWLVTGRKTGVQSLILVIHRLIKFDGQEYWREVESYQAQITVEVTFGQWLGSSGWKWIGGLMIIALLIPVLWRWYGQRENRKSISTPSPVFSRVSRRGDANVGHIFISYRRSDSADIAGRIYDRLVDEFGRSPIFKDVDSIPLGTDFKEHLDRKVSESKVLLAIIGDGWINARDEAGNRRLDDAADFVRVEIESAFERSIPVIPLLVRGAHMPEEESLPVSLRKLVYRNGIPIRPDPDFHNDMDRLISALNEYL